MQQSNHGTRPGLSRRAVFALTLQDLVNSQARREVESTQIILDSSEIFQNKNTIFWGLTEVAFHNKQSHCSFQSFVTRHKSTVSIKYMWRKSTCLVGTVEVQEKSDLTALSSLYFSFLFPLAYPCTSASEQPGIVSIVFPHKFCFDHSDKHLLPSPWNKHKLFHSCSYQTQMSDKRRQKIENIYIPRSRYSSLQPWAMQQQGLHQKFKEASYSLKWAQQPNITQDEMEITFWLRGLTKIKMAK